MTYRYKVTYWPLNQYGLRYTKRQRTGYVRAHSMEEASKNAVKKFHGEVTEVW